MQSVGQIVRLRREALGLTLAALAGEVGATKSYLSMIENHRVANPPSRQLLVALERALGIAQGELVRAGEWEKTPAHVRRRVEDLSENLEKSREVARWLLQSSSKRGDGARNLDKMFRSGELTRRVKSMLGDSRPGGSVDTRVPVRFRVPLINKVAAGYPRDFTDLDYPARVADEYIPVPELADPQAFAARVVGDSMEPEYHEGDILVFSPAAKVADGADCFVRLVTDSQATFKRVFFDARDGKNTPLVRLQPLNPQFPPRVLEREQITGIYKAVWRFSKLG